MKKKFLVMKQDDIVKYLTFEEMERLLRLSIKIQDGRKADGKTPDNDYLVINKDEAYSPEVIKLMKKNGHWD